MGCAKSPNTGRDTERRSRRKLKRPGFSGRATGVDLSSYLIKVAERLSEEEGAADQVRFQTGDTQSLGFEDASFDAVVAHTLMSHVPDPAAVLPKAGAMTQEEADTWVDSQLRASEKGVFFGTSIFYSCILRIS